MIEESTNSNELAKQYDPQLVESSWYQRWMQSRIYEFPETTEKETFSILMPPPNVTGMLTMGHVLNHTIQDVYIRYNRMKGKQSAWFPGLDHAGIATQSKVEQLLKKEEGISRHDLGREKFIERVYDWKDKYGNIILEQLRSLGNSSDWSKTLFTMDESASNAVREVFIRLFDDGLIYRGKRIINWSPAMLSAISDEEVIMKETKDTMFTLKYYYEDSDEYISVATVRPETIFGDVAVAVNPDDERYTSVIGKKVRVPLTDRYVPIIADSYVEKDFGTGCLKITPAHDQNDFEVGERHNLPILMTLTPDAKLTSETGVYAGLDRFDARKKIAQDLTDGGFVVKAEEYLHKVGYSERGGEVVEPFLSDQWFVKVEPLAIPALKAVQDGRIKFYPEHWSKTYEHWMNNVRDWCISRQLWWGHRIPVYYTEDGLFTSARSEEHARQKLNLSADVVLRQDEDSLDTWFSSWLWMLTTMNWLHDGETEDTPLLATYLPTNLLVTGPDIIFFWVARMIMASLYFKNEVPFKDVYFTSIIRDGEGRKMSKSLGNSPDPLELFKKYGADAVRYTTLYLAPLGQDIKITVVLNEGISDAPQMEFGRNFANKIWNAARFLMMKKSEVASGVEGSATLSEEELSVSDRWIRSRLNSTIQKVHTSLESYSITEYTRVMYDFIWKDFCDWYIEIMKVQFNSNESQTYRLALMNFALDVFAQAMKLLHPIMPFITEEIWHKLTSADSESSVSTQLIPTSNPEFITASVENNFEKVQLLIEELRMMKSQAGIKPSLKLPLFIRCNSNDIEFFKSVGSIISALTKNEEPIVVTELHKLENVLSGSVHGIDIFLVAENLIDKDKERERLTKEQERLENLKRSAEAKLSNEKFVANAKPELVETERKKLETALDGLHKVATALQELA